MAHRLRISFYDLRISPQAKSNQCTIRVSPIRGCVVMMETQRSKSFFVVTLRGRCQFKLVRTPSPTRTCDFMKRFCSRRDSIRDTFVISFYISHNAASLDLETYFRIMKLGFASFQKAFIHDSSRQRPYHVESTSSRPITEVKQRWARLVLGWVTAWEHRVLLAFDFFNSFISCSFFVLPTM